MPARRVSPIDGGMVDGRPFYLLSPRQCSALKNMRVYKGELRTCKGYASSTSSVIRTGVSSINGLSHRVRSDGTHLFHAVSDGGHWLLVGDTKSLLSTGLSHAAIVAVSGTAVSGAAGENFKNTYDVGDEFFMVGDAYTVGVAVTSIETASAMTLSANYAGAVTGGVGAGVWRKSTKARTRTLVWLDRTFFANGADKLYEYEEGQISPFRETGVASAWPGGNGLSSATTTGGSLTAGYLFQYYVCFEDERLKKSNPVDMGQFVATAPATQFTVTAAASGGQRWISAYRLYRSQSSAGTSATLDTARFVASALSGTAITDKGMGRSASETVPFDCFMPPEGLEDLTIIDNRMAGISGQKLYISGLGPTDVHTDTAGRIEPEYWPYQHRIGDGEGGQGYALVTMRGRTFILGQRNSFRVSVNGDDPAVWGIVPDLPNVGCVNRYSIGNGGDRAFWLGYYRGRLTVLAFNGFQLQDIGAAIKGTLDDIDTGKFSQVEAGIGHGFYWLCVPLTGGSYRTLEFNTVNGTWCYRDWQVQCFAQASAGVYAAFNDGLVNELESGYSKAGSDQAYQADTAPFTLAKAIRRSSPGGGASVRYIQAPEWPAWFRSLQVEFETYAGSPDVSASYIVDEGTPTAVPSSPVAISATPMFRVGLQTANYGRRWQGRFEALGSDLDFAIRSIALKGETDERDVD